MNTLDESISIPSPLIHIGFHKTGTSWLQDKVFTNDSEVFHPISKLAPYFVFDENGFKLNSFNKNEDVIKKELNNLLKDSPVLNGRIPVLSYERLSGSPFAAGVNASTHALRLKLIFPKGKVLIVIRNQQDAIHSVYFQYLTGGGTHGIKKFLNARYNGLRPHFSTNHYHYHYIIAEYQNLFGKENVLVLPYELFRDNKESYLSRISDFVGKEINIKNDVKNVFVNKNEYQFVRYNFRFLSKFIKATELNDFPKRHNWITKRVAWAFIKLLKLLSPSTLNSRTKSKVDRVITNHIGSEFRGSNQITQSLTDLDLSLYGYKI